MHRGVLSALAAAILACSGPPPVAPGPTPQYEATCPEAVRIFVTEDRVGRQYHEVALLPAARRSPADPDSVLRAQREQAAGLGANGIILDATARPADSVLLVGPRVGDTGQRAGTAVAIYIPEDARAAREICSGGDVNIARAADGAAADALGYAIQGGATTEPAGDTARVVDKVVASEEIADTAVQPTAEEVRAETARRLAADRSMREALSDVIRLRIISEYRETKPGLLSLTIGEGFGTATSLEYNLLRLYHAYRGVLYYQLPAILELWDDGRKIGEFTRGGLFLDEPSGGR